MPPLSVVVGSWDTVAQDKDVALRTIMPMLGEKLQSVRDHRIPRAVLRRARTKIRLIFATLV